MNFYITTKSRGVKHILSIYVDLRPQPKSFPIKQHLVNGQEHFLHNYTVNIQKTTENHNQSNKQNLKNPK